MLTKLLGASLTAVYEVALVAGVVASVTAREEKQGVALTGRNRTGPPCSVGRPTAYAPGGRHTRSPATLQAMTDDDDDDEDDDDRRQTPANKTILAH